MFRKQNSMIKAWENNGVDLFVNLQHSILKEIVKMLKPGGTLLYSTCTFSPEEDEQSVEYLLTLDKDIHLLELPLVDGFDKGHPEWGNTNNDDLTMTIRLWQHRLAGEGHFLAMATKDHIDFEDTYIPYRIKKAKLPTEFIDFLQNITMEQLKISIYQVGDDYNDKYDT